MRILNPLTFRAWEEYEVVPPLDATDLDHCLAGSEYSDLVSECSAHIAAINKATTDAADILEVLDTAFQNMYVNGIHEDSREVFSIDLLGRFGKLDTRISESSVFLFEACEYLYRFLEDGSREYPAEGMEQLRNAAIVAIRQRDAHSKNYKIVITTTKKVHDILNERA